ncbi:MAG: TonB-dependent receptor, partial [Bryobacteraceae bacterium]
LDYQPGQSDMLHLDLGFARNWFQIPNTYDQQAAGQDQHQKVLSYNIAPGYIHLFGPSMVLALNPYLRQDQVSYYPSRDPFDDSPATLGQNRRLSNLGVRADLSYSKGIHNIKAGLQVSHEFLTEHFRLGVTDPAYNAPCVDSTGQPIGDPSQTGPGQCAGAGDAPNQSFFPGLVPYDLSRSGSLFFFNGHTDVKEYGFYVQDQIKVGNFTINAGLRGDIYRGLSADAAAEPRFGVSYLIKRTGTVLRASYSHTLETPYNENLILSSATGIGGLGENVFGAQAAHPLAPGRRNQYNAGLQQSLGKYFVVDGDYFWKYTDNAFDFDTLLNTPVTFPISWRKSKIDGVSARLSMPNFRGFSWFTVMGHTRARFFGPEVGGLIFNSPVAANVFRIDHDQAFQQTTDVRYQYKKRGPWISVTWRYDSGEVAGAVPDEAAALALTSDQQVQSGVFCGSTEATLLSPIRACPVAQFGTTRLRIPAPGTYNEDTNPSRIAPRNLFDAGAGFDNLFPHGDKAHFTLTLTVTNLTNQAALYNFLSTFSGTHFIAPRTYQAGIGYVF